MDVRDHKESWAPKNWFFWTVVLKKTLENPLNCIEIQPVHPKGDQSWVFIGKTDIEVEIPIFRSPDVKSWLIGKDPDAGKDLGQEEKGTTEDEMVGWHHQLKGHGFGWTLGVGDGQGGLVCCGSWVAKSQTRLSDWNERNWSTLVFLISLSHSCSGYKMGIYSTNIYWMSIMCQAPCLWTTHTKIFTTVDFIFYCMCRRRGQCEESTNKAMKKWNA